MKNIVIGIAILFFVWGGMPSASAASLDIPELENLSWGESTAEVSQKYSLNSFISIDNYTMSTGYTLYGQQIEKDVKLFFFKDNLYTVYISFMTELTPEIYADVQALLTEDMGKSVGSIESSVNGTMMFWVNNTAIVGFDKNGISYTSLSLTRKLLANNELDFKAWQELIVSDAKTN